MEQQLTLEMVQKSIAPHHLDLGNSYLYQICNNHFQHKTVDEVIAKTITIGRTYAAALERRKNKENDEINDNFYFNTVAPKFIQSDLDVLLSELRLSKELTNATIQKVLSAHQYLVNLIEGFTKMKKRSFASKYLHFHLPQLFYIYDKRACDALKLFAIKVPAKFIYPFRGEKEYTKFFSKCHYLQNIITEKYDYILTPRQLDNLLIEVANKNAVPIKL